MALTLASLKMHVTHPEPGGPSNALPPAAGTADDIKEQIINEAGRLLYQAHPWKFRERPPKKLNFSAPITLTGATWTESSKTITKTGAFASYTFAPGDLVEIEDGTGATDGLYPIASKTSSDAIVLADSIGSGADGQSDIAGSIEFPYCAFPSDFGEMLKLQADGLNVGFELTTFGQLAMLRDAGSLPAGAAYYGAITNPAQGVQTAAMGLPRLELYPAPIAAQVGALTLWYRADWRELSEDTHCAAVPLWAERLLIEYIQINAMGYSERYVDGAGIVSIHDRLEELESRPLFKRAVQKDSLLQPDYGVLRGGLIGAMTSCTPSVVRTQDQYEVAEPFIT